MKAYIPSNLNLGAEKHSDKFYYIITLIYYSRIFDKRIKKDAYIPLNGQVLHKILGGRYIKYIRRLLDLGIIESDRNYIPNKKSIGYRFTAKYRNVKFKKVDIVNERLIEKIELHKKFQKTETLKNSTHAFLYKCLRNVNVDYTGAYNWIEQNITNINFDEYNSYSSSIDLIYSKDFYFTNSSMSGRVFTNVTNLPKSLRKFLSYDGKELVEIDLANSQPFFLIFLILEYFNVNYPYSSTYSSSNYLSYDTQNIIPEDVQKYIEITSCGQLYEYLMDYLNYDGDRKEFKVKVFKKIFYCVENGNYVYKERRIFTKLFPTVARVISHYKKEDYKNISHKLQKAEADIMINKIVPKLAAQNIYVLTIHDSVLTTPDNAETVKKIILNEFKNKYGLIPTVRIKRGDK